MKRQTIHQMLCLASFVVLLGLAGKVDVDPNANILHIAIAAVAAIVFMGVNAYLGDMTQR